MIGRKKKAKGNDGVEHTLSPIVITISYVMRDGEEKGVDIGIRVPVVAGF
jgi:hypothetical protein